MEVQGDIPIIQWRVIKRDKQLEDLFQQCSEKQEKQQKQEEYENQNIQEEEIIVQVDRQKLQKGYLSEGYEKPSNINIRRRKNSIIKKVKEKEKKRKNKKNKLYIQMLEGKVYELQKQLETAKKLNQMNRQYVKKLSQGQHIVTIVIIKMNGLFVSKQRYIENIEQLLKQKEINNQALRKQYSNMRYRQGVFGKDRTKAINYYFSEISQLFFSDTLKYLIKTAYKGQDFFDQNFLKYGDINKSNDQQNIIHIMNFPRQNLTSFEFLRQDLLNQKHNLDKKFEIFYSTKCQIMETSRKMEMIIDGMRRFLNHEQISKIIVFADHQRFRKSISVKQFHEEVFQKLEKEDYQYNPQNLFQTKKLM